MGRFTGATSPRAIEATGPIGLVTAALSQPRRMDEGATILQLLWIAMCGGDAFGELLECPPIVSRHWEFQIEGFRADLVLFHIDGSVTIVEAKSQTRSVIELAGGIGQLLVYASALPKTLGYEPPETRLILAFPRIEEQQEDDSLNAACMAAGVRPLRLVSPAEMYRMVDRDFRWLTHGA